MSNQIGDEVEVSFGKAGVLSNCYVVATYEDANGPALFVVAEVSTGQERPLGWVNPNSVHNTKKGSIHSPKIRGLAEKYVDHLPNN